MSEFWLQIQTPSWWVGVVIVGILINLISDYAKPQLDKYMSRTFIWWSLRSEQRRSARNKIIEKIKVDSQERNIYIAHEMRYRLRSIEAFLMGIICFGGSFYVRYKSQNHIYDGFLPIAPEVREQSYSILSRILNFFGALSLFQSISRKGQAAMVKNLISSSREEKIDNTLEFFD